MTQKRRIIYLLMGPALFALACLAIPSSIFDTLAARGNRYGCLDGVLVGNGAGRLCRHGLFADCS
ncbi:MAG: hypothetical protein PUB08_03995 [Firmicutes bacterium]|nr:hypothetical protein [Bacillota bacterium]